MYLVVSTSIYTRYLFGSQSVNRHGVFNFRADRPIDYSRMTSDTNGRCRTSVLDRTYCDTASMQLGLLHGFKPLLLTKFVLGPATCTLQSDMRALCLFMCVSVWLTITSQAEISCSATLPVYPRFVRTETGFYCNTISTWQTRGPEFRAFRRY